jgi:hypothetical protein
MDQDKSSSGSSLPVEQRKQRRRRRCRRQRRRERQNQQMAGRGWPARANLKPYVRSVESSPGRKNYFFIYLGTVLIFMKKTNNCFNKEDYLPS